MDRPGGCKTEWIELDHTRPLRFKVDPCRSGKALAETVDVLGALSSLIRLLGLIQELLKVLTERRRR